MSHIRLIIARYAENIDWVAECTEYLKSKFPTSTVHVHVYTKFIDIPGNTGREASTYVHHIIKHYDMCDDSTYWVFLQGQIDDHREHFLEHVHELVSDAMSHPSGASLSSAKAHDFGKDSATASFRIASYKGSHVEPAGVAFGPWFEKMLRLPFPRHPVIWWDGALFCIRSSLVKRLPLKMWQTFMDALSTHEHPETAHYMERAWVYCFAFSKPIVALSAWSDNYVVLYERWRRSLPLGFVDHATHIDIEGAGDVYSLMWYDAIERKLMYFVQELQKLPDDDIVLCSDIDILFTNQNTALADYAISTFGKHRETLMIFMREHTTSFVNGGFYFVRNCSIVRHALHEAAVYCRRRTQYADQDYFNGDDFKALNIPIQFLPLELVAWSKFIFDRTRVLFHHAVCSLNSENKVSQQEWIAHELGLNVCDDSNM